MRRLGYQHVEPALLLRVTVHPWPCVPHPSQGLDILEDFKDGWSPSLAGETPFPHLKSPLFHPGRMVAKDKPLWAGTPVIVKESPFVPLIRGPFRFSAQQISSSVGESYAGPVLQQANVWTAKCKRQSSRRPQVKSFRSWSGGAESKLWWIREGRKPVFSRHQ